MDAPVDDADLVDGAQAAEDLQDRSAVVRVRWGATRGRERGEVEWLTCLVVVEASLTVYEPMRSTCWNRSPPAPHERCNTRRTVASGMQ